VENGHEFVRVRSVEDEMNDGRNRTEIRPISQLKNFRLSAVVDVYDHGNLKEILSLQTTKLKIHIINDN
jgi:hypothetical protein